MTRLTLAIVLSCFAEPPPRKMASRLSKVSEMAKHSTPQIIQCRLLDVRTPFEVLGEVSTILFLLGPEFIGQHEDAPRNQDRGCDKKRVHLVLPNQYLPECV